MSREHVGLLQAGGLKQITESYTSIDHDNLNHILSVSKFFEKTSWKNEYSKIFSRIAVNIENDEAVVELFYSWTMPQRTWCAIEPCNLA